MRAKTKSARAARTTRRTRAGAPSKDSGVLLRFRPRTPEDDEYIVTLTERELGDVHQQAFGEPFPREQFLRYLQSGVPTVVVEKNKKRIGYYSYLLSPDGRMHISAMVIDPQHQSNGVGTKVMRELEREAQARGAHTIEVFVQTGNARSLAFTRKLGFVEAYYVTPTTICFHKRIGASAQASRPGQLVPAAPHLPASH